MSNTATHYIIKLNGTWVKHPDKLNRILHSEKDWGDFYPMLSALLDKYGHINEIMKCSKNTYERDIKVFEFADTYIDRDKSILFDDRSYSVSLKQILRATFYSVILELVDMNWDKYDYYTILENDDIIKMTIEGKAEDESAPILDNPPDNLLWYGAVRDVIN